MTYPTTQTEEILLVYEERPLNPPKPKVLSEIERRELETFLVSLWRPFAHLEFNRNPQYDTMCKLFDTLATKHGIRKPNIVMLQEDLLPRPVSLKSIIVITDDFFHKYDLCEDLVLITDLRAAIKACVPHALSGE